jgi:uncharacterized NAD(P)/FAD-binding protein YdhS
MKKIGIIGGGFSGTMTAVHLIRKATHPVEIVIVNERETFNRGVAFNPYSREHLLNVPAAKMSAFNNQPEHFLNWLVRRDGYTNKDRKIIANAFLPRYVYGDYIADLWNETVASSQGQRIKIRVVDALVEALEIVDNCPELTLDNGERFTVDACVIASGNHIPRNPPIDNAAFYTNKNYFQSPWDGKCVSGIAPNLPVCIIGNGLTMVDTVLGLLENNFNNEIYSISPNGFNILPHRHSGLHYSGLAEELTDTANLYDVVRLFNKHIKLIREFGLSAEPIVDSLRPHAQTLWLRMTEREKSIFIARLRHLWGVARHRIPLHIHDRIQQLRIDNKLHIFAGKLLNIVGHGDDINVTFYNKKTRKNKEIVVSRVVNCTGPESDIMRLEKSFLKNCLKKGIACQDPLKLGINADPETLRVIDRDGQAHSNLFTIGSNLRGTLWETTAVNEIRQQAEALAQTMLAALKTERINIMTASTIA